MNGDVRFMNEVFRIVGGALRLDIDKVRNYTAFLADKLDAAGETASATRIWKMLDESDRQLRPATFPAVARFQSIPNLDFLLLRK